MIVLVIVQQLDLIYVDVIQLSNDFLCLKQELVDGCLKQENGKVKVELVINDGFKYLQFGMLEFLDVIVDQIIGLIMLCVIFLNLDYILLLGMFVCVCLEEGINFDVLLVL